MAVQGARSKVLQDVSTVRMEAAFGYAQARSDAQARSVDQDIRVAPLDIRVAPLSALEGIDLNEIQVWCVRNAVYQVPTQELVDNLRSLIGYRKAIEICAGHGAVGRALGIPMTDSYMQQISEVRAKLALMQQPTIDPPLDVERLEALEAVQKYNPEVVVGCFVTQLGTPDVPQSSPYGVDENALLAHPSVKRYILVGNVDVHGQRRIMQKLHDSWGPDPCLVSRGFNQDLNRIWTWDCT